MTLSNHSFQESAKVNRDVRYLPDRNTSDLLLTQYWKFVHPVARVLHRPSFNWQWMAFWGNYELGKKIDKFSLALISTTLFAASVSIPDQFIQRELKQEKSKLIRQMQAAAENALARSNWISITQIEALQAVVVYLVRLKVSYHAILSWI